MFNDLDCTKCTKELRRVRGCDGTKTHKILGFEAHGCPARHIDSVTYEYLAAYANWQKGILPNEGGWLDQPSKFWQIIDVVTSVFNKLEQEENARHGTEYMAAAKR